MITVRDQKAIVTPEKAPGLIPECRGKLLKLSNQTPECPHAPINRCVNERGWGFVLAAMLVIAAWVATGPVLAQQAPVLQIAPTGTNLLTITITNGLSTTNYTLLWTPGLQNTNYAWQVLGVGEVGETNFTVDTGEWMSSFFRVILGSDYDGDGVPDWQDAQPENAAVGILS